jgi:hypothetical protein
LRWRPAPFGGTRKFLRVRPDWKYLADFQCKPLSDKEQAFMDGPVQRLCAMLDDWQVQQDRDLSPEVWDFLKRERFFGMVIPEEFGGLGFSEIGHSRVVTRIASRSIAAAVTVMVPNSLGPGELLVHYGTDEQKKALSRTPRHRPGNSMLRTHGSGGWLGCSRHAIGRHRRTWHMERRTSTWAATELEQALHHARTRRDTDRSGLPVERSRSFTRRDG